MDKLQRLYEQIEQAPAYSKEVEDFKLWVLAMIKKEMEVRDMAIKALEQEPCDDAVSRESVLDQTYLWSKDEFLRVTNPFDYLRKRINALPPATPKPTECEDAINREHLLFEINELMQSPWFNNGKDDDGFTHCGYVERKEAVELVRDLCVKTEPPVTPVIRWIPVSERLPEDLEPVNITWVNHDPESYYMDIKDKPFTATGVYFNGQWYWWSTLCTDTLAEYSHNYSDIIDDAIEVTAWMPLPESWKGESE